MQTTNSHKNGKLLEWEVADIYLQYTTDDVEDKPSRPKPRQRGNAASLTELPAPPAINPTCAAPNADMRGVHNLDQYNNTISAARDDPYPTSRTFDNDVTAIKSAPPDATRQAKQRGIAQPPMTPLNPSSMDNPGDDVASDVDHDLDAMFVDEEEAEMRADPDADDDDDVEDVEKPGSMEDVGIAGGEDDTASVEDKVEAPSRRYGTRATNAFQHPGHITFTSDDEARPNTSKAEQAKKRAAETKLAKAKVEEVKNLERAKRVAELEDKMAQENRERGMNAARPLPGKVTIKAVRSSVAAVAKPKTRGVATGEIFCYRNLIKTNYAHLDLSQTEGSIVQCGQDCRQRFGC